MERRGYRAARGVRETLGILGRHVPLDIHAVPSGTECFDWTVPDEWEIRDAYVMTEDGERIVDFRRNNLHVVGYSEPVDATMSLDELSPHLHTLPEQPDAVPYVTSYYNRYWGFCLSHRQLETLGQGPYQVRIDSTLAPGVMNYGELLIEGECADEVLLSTYVCHPSMANNELSGPVLTTYLARALLDRGKPKYSYRILYLPETIGAICYLSRHLDELRRRVVAGYVVTCIGGPDDFTYLASRSGATLADRVALHALRHCGAPYKKWDFTRRASDERQYCAPGIDLPVCSLMRSKYHDYPEYHTSLDDLDFVRPEHLEASYDLYMRCIDTLEVNARYRTTTLGEPNLGRRGLYPTLGDRTHLVQEVEDMLALLAHSDGTMDVLAIADLYDRPTTAYGSIAVRLVEAGLLDHVEATGC
jgi:aminopeptidase-like protein